MNPYTQAEEKVRDIAALPENWDTYGSPPLSAVAHVRAMDLLAALERGDVAPPECVAPVPGGGLQFEGFAPGFPEVELEIMPDGSLAWLLAYDGDALAPGSLTCEGQFPPHLHEAAAVFGVALAAMAGRGRGTP